MILVVAAVLAYASTATGVGDNKKDQEMMQGTWLIDSFQDSDPKGGIPPDVLKELVVTIKDDSLKVSAKDQVVVHLKFKLDSSKNPKAVDFTHLEGPDKGKTELGIYKFDGQKLIFATNDAEMPRPTAFATKEKTKISVITLKKK
jgi:uncharacterized protein (TIGR03067 family)